MTETRAGSLRLVPNKASLYARRTIPKNEKKWIVIHAHSRYGGDLAVSISKTVTTMLRHFDHDERESDGSRHWDSIKSVFGKKVCPLTGARRFSVMKRGYKKIFEGQYKEENRILQRQRWILCYVRPIQGHSGGIPIEPELMGYVFLPRNLKRDVFQKGLSWNYQSTLAT